MNLVSWTKSVNYEAFLGSIRANPLDATNYLVYADWLEEQGHPEAKHVRRLGDKLDLIVASIRLNLERMWELERHWFSREWGCIFLHPKWRDYIFNAAVARAERAGVPQSFLGILCHHLVDEFITPERVEFVQRTVTLRDAQRDWCRDNPDLDTHDGPLYEDEEMMGFEANPLETGYDAPWERHNVPPLEEGL